MSTVAVAGAGNLANSLVPALKKSGFEVTRIYSRTFEHARNLAVRVNAEPAASVSELGKADFYILSVPDSFIENVASALPENNGITLHVSGSTDIDVLKPYCVNCGVMYPLQTFSSERQISDFKNIPVFIEADSEKSLTALKNMAEKISENIFVLNSCNRMRLHVAAVFACNFFNSILSCAFDICREYSVDPLALKLLTEETLNKAFSSADPEKMQTGPAIRGDMKTVEKHLALLENNPALQGLYRYMTSHILLKRN